MSYYFNLPPISELNLQQVNAVRAKGSVSLGGGPGTGKSVVSLWRHLENIRLGKTSLLLCYNLTLEYYLKNALRKYSQKASINISRTLTWTTNNRHKNIRYSEIIIDEAQDCEIDRYEIISKKCLTVCFGADDQQQLYKNKGSKSSEIKALFNIPLENEFRLQRNYRCSKQVLSFVRHVIPTLIIPDRMYRTAYEGALPRCINNLSSYKMKEYCEKLCRNYLSDAHNIAILVLSRRDVDEYYKYLYNLFPGKVSSYKSGDGSFTALENIHVSTYSSSKGTEFDTVIMPNFDSMDNLVDDVEFITYKHYFVSMTRAKRNLFLLNSSNKYSSKSNIYYKSF